MIPQIAEHVEYLVGEARIETERRLVDQQQARAHDERTRDLEQTTFAAAEHARGLVAARREDRAAFEHPLGRVPRIGATAHQAARRARGSPRRSCPETRNCPAARRRCRRPGAWRWDRDASRCARRPRCGRRECRSGRRSNAGSWTCRRRSVRSGKAPALRPGGGRRRARPRRGRSPRPVHRHAASGLRPPARRGARALPRSGRSGRRNRHCERGTEPGRRSLDERIGSPSPCRRGWCMSINVLPEGCRCRVDRRRCGPMERPPKLRQRLERCSSKSHARSTCARTRIRYCAGSSSRRNAFTPRCRASSNGGMRSQCART